MKNLPMLMAAIVAVVSMPAVSAVPGWSGDQEVKWLRVHGSQRVYGNFVSGTTDCGQNSFILEREVPTDATQASDHPLFDQTFSILLAAQVSGSKVQLYQDSCNSTNIAVITGARISD